MLVILDALIVFLPVLMLFAIAFSIAILQRNTMWHTLPQAAFAAILIVYVFGLSGGPGSLRFGYYAVVLTTVVSCIHIAISLRRDSSNIYTAKVMSAAVFVGTCFAFSLWANYGNTYSLWDEFTHWGIVVKNMYTYDVFGSHPIASTTFKSYLPAISIFQYFFTAAFSRFLEFPSFIASNMLYFFVVMPFLSYDKLRKSSVEYGIIVATVILMPLTIGRSLFYSSLYVDQILGVLFGAVLAHYFIFGLTKKSIWYIAGSLAILTLAKDSGLGLALVVAVTMFIDMLLFRRESLVARFGKLKALLVSVAPLSLVLLAKVSWSLHLTYMRVDRPLGLYGAFQKWQQNGLAEYQQLIVRDFFHALWATRLGWLDHPFTVISFMVMSMSFTLAIVVYLLANKVISRAHIARLCTVVTCLLGGAIAYTSSILLMYVFRLPKMDAVRLDSFGRYMGTYLLALLVLGLLLVFANFDLLSSRVTRFRPVLLLILFLAVVFANSAGFQFLRDDIIKARNRVAAAQAMAVPFEESRKILPYIHTGTDKVCFIIIGGQGFGVFRLRYVLSPPNFCSNTLVQTDWSVGLAPYYYEGDPWTKIVTPDEWSAYLKEQKYTLVYVYKADERFVTTYGGLFDTVPVDGSLYRVLPTANGVSLMHVNVD